MNERFSYDSLILGAGPAGLQLGFFLQAGDSSSLIVEAANRCHARCIVSIACFEEGNRGKLVRHSGRF